MYEIAEFIEPYGMWIIKTVKTEEEAKRYCDERNKSGRLDYRYRKI
jgi:hypothetical protein